MVYGKRGCIHEKGLGKTYILLVSNVTCATVNSSPAEENKERVTLP